MRDSIGIMGGTFDPIHNGHLLLAHQAYREYGLDSIWFMPSGHPPHKQDHHVTDGGNRRDMVKLAIEGVPYFQYSDFELRRPGSTYSAQTFHLLNEAYPALNFYFIVGADSLYQIEHWYHPRELMRETTLLVAGRECDNAPRSLDQQIRYLSDRFQAKIFRLHCQEMDVSSAMLRQMAAQGVPIDSYLPPGVADYIRKNGLYRKKKESV